MRRSIYGLFGGIAAMTVVAVSIMTSGCAVTSRADPFAEESINPRDYEVQSTPDDIGPAEILERGRADHTAMKLIRRLRPSWLRSRGQKSFTDEGATYPIVYIDEIRHGTLSTLHTIPTSEIASIHFIGTADATTRWGTGHPSGVINIVTGR